MKTKIIFILVIAAAFCSCAQLKHIPLEEKYNKEWVNRSYNEIVTTFGAPDRIEYDGKDGCILIYEKFTTVETTDVDTHFGMFDPDYKTTVHTDKKYVHFFMGRDDICYLVKSNQYEVDPKSQRRARTAFWLSTGGVILLPLLVAMAVA